MGLDSVELVMDVEAAFGVDLPDAELASARTVGHLHQLILRHTAIPNGSPAALQSWERLVEVVVESTGVARERVTPAAAIVADLGIN